MKKRKRKLLYLLCLFIVFSLVGCSQKKEEKKKEDPSISIVIKDLTPPTILLSVSKIDIFVGDSFSSEQYVLACFDNYDSKITYKVKGSADSSKAGTYEITFSAKDKSGNATQKKLIVNVIEKKKEEPTPNKVEPSGGVSSDGNTSGGSSSSLPERSFMFSDGYTMPGAGNSAIDACLKYKENYPGSCVPIYSHDGYTYVGAKYTPY